ncbi:hypothetical protein GCM10011594_32630 [Nakamurella endophytica]|uniref:Ribbon-helix-helix protein, CopG family n=1 Tax=Nakamurella endophytica TaxID=1748367 RepID=A0A917WKI2_9ACTN|nr:hypothetical protein GCM10011594_32630 [Nakamurella endophytica]
MHVTTLRRILRPTPPEHQRADVRTSTAHAVLAVTVDNPDNAGSAGAHVRSRTPTPPTRTERTPPVDGTGQPLSSNHPGTGHTDTDTGVSDRDLPPPGGAGHYMYSMSVPERASRGSMKEAVGVHIKLTPELYAQFDRAAAERGISKRALLTAALERELSDPSIDKPQETLYDVAS